MALNNSLMRFMDATKYKAKSGKFIPVWTLEVQTQATDVDKILDAVTKVDPLSYGRYSRNASISAQGVETSRPAGGSSTVAHNEDYQIGSDETYPMVELKISISRDYETLANVMDAIHFAHHYEEPVIFLREDWASRSNYNPDNENPNRWWNNARGMPEKVHKIPKE